MSKGMHYVNACYANAINRERGRVGHRLQGRYEAILIERDSYLLELSRYIHLNPVRAGVVERPQAYPYNSYGACVEGKEDELLSVELILEMSGGQGKARFGRYREFVERVQERKLALAGISHRRQLRVSWTAEEVVGAVARELKLAPEEALKKGDSRNMAICLVKRHSGMSNRQVWGVVCGPELFGHSEGQPRVFASSGP